MQTYSLEPQIAEHDGDAVGLAARAHEDERGLARVLVQDEGQVAVLELLGDEHVLLLERLHMVAFYCVKDQGAVMRQYVFVTRKSLTWVLPRTRVGSLDQLGGATLTTVRAKASRRSSTRVGL